MSIPIVINNKPFNYPQAGSDPSWGPDASDAFIELVNVTNTLLAPGDILETVFNVPDNISTFTTVNGLAFDPSVVRAANIFYSIYRTSVNTPSGNAEAGTLRIVYDNNASAGSKWSLRQDSDGSGGVIFNIIDTGQIQYKSSQIDTGGGGYTGILKFSAKTTSI